MRFPLKFPRSTRSVSVQYGLNISTVNCKLALIYIKQAIFFWPRTNTGKYKIHNSFWSITSESFLANHEINKFSGTDQILSGTSIYLNNCRQSLKRGPAGIMIIIPNICKIGLRCRKRGLPLCALNRTATQSITEDV